MGLLTWHDLQPEGETDRAEAIVSILILVCVILLPILPAFLLFKILPSTAIVSGPLQGFTVNLSGAFAGYFAVVVLVIASHNILFPRPQTYQVWELSGTVTDESGNPIQPLAATDVVFDPPIYQPDLGGVFSVKFPTIPAPGGGTTYPKLFISHNEYEPVPIDLDPKLGSMDGVTGMERDNAAHKIRIKRISLKKMPQLAAAGDHP
ncbi:MAG: hypothetical protein ACRD23_17420 [Terriglobales bacterium]